jgi:heptosyltransferase I
MQMIGHKPSKSIPESILIIRLSAIGDNVMATPLIHAFRQKYPHARIDWLAQPESIDLVSCHPDLNKVIEWPTRYFKKLIKAKKWITFLKAWSQAIKGIRKQKYEWIVDTQGLMKSGIIARLSGAKYIIGLGSREGSQFLVHEQVPKIHGNPRISSEYLDLAQFLELPVEPFEMLLRLPKASYESAEKVIKEFSLSNGFVCICPFTTRPQKHWFEDYWVKFIDQWYARTTIPCVMLGGPGDSDASNRIERQIAKPGSLINLAEERFLSIPDAAALIEKTDLLIGVDTGMTHMAIAHKRPTICIFGSTVPYTETHTPGVKIHFQKLSCAPCRKHPTCNGAFDCMRMVTPELILSSALELFPR